MRHTAVLAVAAAVLIFGAGGAWAAEYKVVIGGLPNFTLRVGQTAALTATVYKRDAPPPDNKWEKLDLTETERIVWLSSKPEVARIDPNGTLTLLAQGEAIITAAYTPVGTAAASAPVTDRKRVVVNLGYAYINASDRVWNSIRSYNSGLASAGARMELADIAPSRTDGSAAFISGFRSAFGVDPRHITAFDISGSPSPSCKTPLTSFKDGSVAIRPSMGLTLGTQHPSGGGAVAIQYTYSLKWSEISSLLGRQVASLSNADAEALFDKISLVFTDESGSAVTLIDKRGSSGVSFAQAVASNVLRISSIGAGADDGVVMNVDVMLSDAKSIGATQANIINGFLVVGDGTPNGSINGDVWLLAPASTDGGASGGSSDGSGSGGGGGCDAGALALAALAIPMAIRRRK